MTMEQYTKQVAKHLRCTGTRKKEIIKQLQSDIGTALEAGDSLETIFERIGTPEEQAAEFNENFDEREIKRAKRIKAVSIFGGAAVILAVFISLVWWMLPKQTGIEESVFFTENQLKEQTEQLLDFYHEKDYDRFFACMTEKMQKALTVEKLEEACRMIAVDYGAFRNYGNYYMAEIRQGNQRYAVVQVNAAYEKVGVTYTILFDTDGKVTGFYMK
ncbi:MAG: DUF3887 domain-containing protein [Bacteroidales bacterium]|nr:DUF3887 domain-containing protein [Clostridium sp.]MCM1203040.1 DUF3887 domain-containing protein [Bacteroidales bacterium]